MAPVHTVERSRSSTGNISRHDPIRGYSLRAFTMRSAPAIHGTAANGAAAVVQPPDGYRHQLSGAGRTGALHRVTLVARMRRTCGGRVPSHRAWGRAYRYLKALPMQRSDDVGT